MEDWQHRVVSEKAQVDMKLADLAKFLYDEEKVIEAGIQPDDFVLLIDQQEAMRKYSEILGERISRFAK